MTNKRKTIIPINEEYRITADEYQWIIQKKRSRKGKEDWKSQHFFGTLEAAVGIPMYNGYITSAKVNATKENHSRIRDFVAASLTKCASGSQYVVLQQEQNRGLGNRPCSATTSRFTWYLVIHFISDGWKNPYSTPPPQCCHLLSSTNPPLGKTYFWATGINIRITTNVGTSSGRNDYLSATVMKE